MADTDQSLYNLRYNQVVRELEGFGGGTPQWTPLIMSSGGGITQLTGDATAGPGSGSQVLTLATVNSNVGSFTNANITVNAKGQVTAAANGSSGGSGKLLQTVFASTATNGSGITSTTYVPTGITVSITPTSTSSTIIITCSGSVELDAGGGNAVGWLSIFENSVDLGPGSSNGMAQVFAPTAGTSIGALTVLATSTHGGTLTPLTYVLNAKVSGGTLTTPTNSSQCTIMVQEIML